jgi:hypothetical protein
MPSIRETFTGVHRYRGVEVVYSISFLEMDNNIEIESMHAYIHHLPFFLAFFRYYYMSVLRFTRPRCQTQSQYPHNHTLQLGSLRAPHLDEVLLALLHSDVDRAVVSRRFRHEAVRSDVA